MKNQKIGVLHYSAPPVIGGVEAVMKAHLNEFNRAGYSCTVIAGRGNADALPANTNFVEFPQIDSQHPEIIQINQDLENGKVPPSFEPLKTQLVERLDPILRDLDHLIIHNVFTKHFNLPLTGALHDLLDQNATLKRIAWCHDFTWTSPSSSSKVFPGYPWDLLRTMRTDCTYVAVSRERQQTLAGLFDCPLEEIELIYNGVDPIRTLGLSEQGMRLADELSLMKSDINLLMPVRVTRAKNIEFALHVVAALKDMGIKPMLLVTGPPDPHEIRSMEYYQTLKNLRTKLGVNDQMRFVFESGPDRDQPFMIDEQVVGDLYRISDVMFMPSHREGFGMPVLEAGLVGIPVLSREVPAATELAEKESLIFSEDSDASFVAAELVNMLERSPVARLRQRVRKQYTWQAIFEDRIQPLLQAEKEF
ncbi:MAG: glycosyltransferase family 4 protein [Anaerolineales bacterium]|jgi:glycosyltransferase involved in cell wall biosynthesis